MTNSSGAWGLPLVLATALISGFSIFVNKFGVSGINSDVYAFARSVVVSVFLISILLLFKQFAKLKQLSKTQWLKLSAIARLASD